MVYNQASLSAFRCGGKIKAVVYPESIDELAQAISLLKDNDMLYKIIANGTNILINDNGIDGVVICTKNLCGIDIDGDILKVSCGESMAKLAIFAMQNSLSGMEGLCSIPGTLGGGIVMNCSAFGRQISDIVDYVDMFIDGKIQRINAVDMGFDYRYSYAKDMGFVVGAGLKLSHGDRNRINLLMQDYKKARLLSQPGGISLGSTFKKAGNISAGYYIEKAGLKGRQIGGAIISQKHANFIINTGGAKAEDFIALGNLARQEVDKQFGIKLKYEVEFM